MTQYQRTPDGGTDPPSSYPPIPKAVRFQHHGYEIPTIIHYWCWRPDFNSWGACISFKDGTRTVTAPKLEPVYETLAFDRPFGEERKCIAAYFDLDRYEAEALAASLCEDHAYFTEVYAPDGELLKEFNPDE